MIKTLFTLLLTICAVQTLKAQNEKDTIIYYLKTPNKVVDTKDSADYFMVFLPGDSSTGVWAYQFTQFFMNGKPKKVGHSLRQTEYLQLHGNVLSFYPNGKKQSAIAYEKGNQIGNSVFYYPNGKLWKLTIEKDVPSNKPFPANSIKHISLLQECRDSTGKVLTENGNGTWIDYSDDFKRKFAEGQVLSGREEGEWRGDLSDSTNYTCTYKDGEISGTGYGYDKAGNKYPFKQVEVIPEFPKGIEAFGRFLANAIRFPKDERENGVSGKVIVTFVVERNGQLVDLKVLSSPSPGFSEEALRVLKLSPNWIPGYQYGFPVRVSYTVPIAFTLDR